MAIGVLTRILASVEIARIELEYASADLAVHGGLDDWQGDSGALEAMLGKLRLARAALAAAQETLDDAATTRPVALALS
jgi:hypothetical protein